MAKNAGARLVQCYLCRHRFEVAARAMSVSCPGCHKPLIVQDVVVDTYKAVSKLQTCGRLIVKRKGRVVAKLIEAHGGIEVDGVLEAAAVSGRPVRIGARGQWKGDCRCPALAIESGARVLGGYFVVPDDPLGLADLGSDGAPAAPAAVEPKPTRPRAPRARRTPSDE